MSLKTDGQEDGPLILIADDEDIMREVLTIMIEENGGRVVEATDGKNALDLFTQFREEIHCVIVDCSMPKMSGFEAYTKMSAMSPELPVLFISGHSLPDNVSGLTHQEGVVFLSKPFHESELIHMLKLLLNQGASYDG